MKVKGYKSIVTAVDCTSKFVETELSKEKTGKALTTFLHKLASCRYGSCNIHIRDKGRELFISFTEEFYHLTCTYHPITSCYQPQANGLVECKNSATEDYIQKYVDERDTWLELLDGILLSMSISRHSPTKFSLFHMMNNREPVTKFELVDT